MDAGDVRPFRADDAVSFAFDDDLEVLARKNERVIARPVAARDERKKVGAERHLLLAIERAIAKRLPRVTVPDFDYRQRPAERLEIPIHERIAAIRARKSEDRARSAAKAARKEAVAPAYGPKPSSRPHPRRRGRR